MSKASEKWRAYLRELIYPVLFSGDPIAEADRVVETIVTGQGESAEEFLEAVKIGLASKESLAELIPQKHSENTIRDFLIEVARKLEKITKKQ